MKAPTVDQLAAALGLAARSVSRMFARGMPRPAVGETIDAWVSRARQWQDANRSRPGPKSSSRGSAKDAADIAYRKLRTQKLKLEVDVLRGELHSRTECEAAAVHRLAELRAAFTQLPDALARRLYQAPSPEAIKLVVEEELRRAFEVLTGGADRPDAGDASGPAVA